MLMNDFYTLDEVIADEKSLTGRISFNASHEIFKGHFPGQPVVPGVCTMQIITEILEQYLNRKLLLTEAQQVKFLQLITPDIQPNIQLQWYTDAGDIIAQAILKTDKDVFKLNGKFTGKE